LIRATSSITVGLVATNLGGIVVVTAWAWLSGGILSIALPAFLANIALLGTFGNVPILIAMGIGVGRGPDLPLPVDRAGWLPPSIVVAADLPGLMLTAMLGSAGIVVLAGYFLARDRALVKARLHDARLAAEQSSRAKAAFLRSMSQEFRAPLEAILGQAESLRAALPGDAREQHSLQGIVIAGQYLGDLLNQLLEMGRVEADETTVRIEPVTVAEVVGPCLAIIRPEVEKRRLTLTDDCGELGARHVWADRVLVRQVVLNLLTNAVKFNREGGSVDGFLPVAGGILSAHRHRRHRYRHCQGAPARAVRALLAPWFATGQRAWRRPRAGDVQAPDRAHARAHRLRLDRGHGQQLLDRPAAGRRRRLLKSVSTTSIARVEAAL
jgi:signal transduction histidine kinase